MAGERDVAFNMVSAEGRTEVKKMNVKKPDQQVLLVGGFHYGFRCYGPFPLDLDDPAGVETEHTETRDHYEGQYHWIVLEPPNATIEDSPKLVLSTGKDTTGGV